MSIGRVYGLQIAKEKLQKKEFNCIVIGKNSLDLSCNSLLQSNINNSIIANRKDDLSKLFVNVVGKEEEIKACHLKIKLLFSYYFDLFNSFISNIDNICVKLYTVEEPECSKYHVDYLSLRMLTTLAGPPTEIISNQFIKRNPLEVIGKPFGLFAGEILLMKGEHWPNNNGNGIVHRSHFSNEKRLIFSIDDMVLL